MPDTTKNHHRSVIKPHTCNKCVSSILISTYELSAHLDVKVTVRNRACTPTILKKLTGTFMNWWAARTTRALIERLSIRTLTERIHFEYPRTGCQTSQTSHHDGISLVKGLDQGLDRKETIPCHHPAADARALVPHLSAMKWDWLCSTVPLSCL